MKNIVIPIPRLSIEITNEQHQKLQSIAKLSPFLKPRMQATEKGQFSSSTFADIKHKARNNI